MPGKILLVGLLVFLAIALTGAILEGYENSRQKWEARKRERKEAKDA